jgi:hypothetical protein
MDPRRLARRIPPGAALLCLLSLVLLVSQPQPLLANPLPTSAIFVHVQPVNPDFCDDNPIVSCPEIVQYTQASGLLEFDLFFYPMMAPPPLRISGFETAVEWPSTWDLVGWEICHGGEGTVDLNGNQASIAINWPSCPTMTEDVFLVARLIINVTSHGHLDYSLGGGSSVRIGCPPDVEEWDTWQLSAEAGVECSFCWMPCDFGDYCNPVPDPTLLELQVRQGETAQRDVHFDIVGGGLVYPCPVIFVTTASWLTETHIELGWDEWLVTLEIDTSGLAPGYHQAWLRGEVECVGCTRVLLEVLPPITGVADPEPPASTSWGRVKTLYR